MRPTAGRSRLSGKWRPSAVSSINQPSQANYWAASMEAWPTEPCNPHVHLRGQQTRRKMGSVAKSAPQLFTFLGERVKGEGAVAGLVTREGGLTSAFSTVGVQSHFPFKWI